MEVSEVRGRLGGTEARPLSMFAAILLILDAPGETFGQHISGLRAASGRSWRPFWLRFGSKIDVNKEIADFLESMLSPAWEHDFSMVS